MSSTNQEPTHMTNFPLNSTTPINFSTATVKEDYEQCAAPIINPKPHAPTAFHLCDAVKILSCYFPCQHSASKLHTGATSVHVLYLCEKWLHGNDSGIDFKMLQLKMEDLYMQPCFYCALSCVFMTRVSQCPISLRSEHPISLHY
jgi:hypothetical protein